MRTTTITIALIAFLGACGGSPAGVRRAENLLRSGDYEGAERTADEELARYPRHPVLWRVKIRAALARGDADRSVALYEEWRALRGGDHDPRALRVMAMATLWQGLHVPSADIKRRSIRAVEKLELEPLAEPVAERMGDDDITVQATAAVAILRSHPDAPYVATMALSSDNPEARAIAIAGIGRKIGAPARDDILAATRDPDARVRRAAVGALAGIARNADAPRLAEIARTDADGQTRARALRALAELRYDAVPAARTALRDDYLGVRLAAVHVLDRAGGDATVDELLLLARGDDAFVALRAGVALARRGRTEPALAAVDRALASDQWTVRAAALNAVAEIASPELGLPIVERAAADPAIGVRLAAARALLRFDRKAAAIELFAAGLASDDPGQRLHAAIDLARAGDRRGAETIAALAGHENPDIREQAVWAHVHLGAPTAALAAALADDSAAVRVTAAEVLLTIL